MKAVAAPQGCHNQIHGIFSQKLSSQKYHKFYSSFNYIGLRFDCVREMKSLKDVFDEILV